MPSMEESRQRVKHSLDNAQTGPDHDAILASLQDEIDQHNAVKDDLRSSMQRHPRSDDEDKTHRASVRFRFKAATEDPRKRKKHSTRRQGHAEHSHRKRKRRTEDYPTPPQESTEPEQADAAAAHPFPREPVNADAPGADPNEAFRTSLFDALADDEGAAYWESVYSQPIHVYPRPSVRSAKGELEAMSDDEYAAYVKTKMWERKHPEIVQERTRKDKEKKLEEEERTRRREEFVRRRERAAWERTQGWKGRDDDEGAGARGNKNDNGEYEFTGHVNRAPGERERENREYAEAWAKYFSAWDQLKYDLLAQRNDPDEAPSARPAPSQRIPWPVLAAKPVIKVNIEAFMHHAPSDDQHPRVQLLKAERVRWHPDKVQQRFAGAVDEGTMKIVTGVFQVVDGLLEEERKLDRG